LRGRGGFPGDHDDQPFLRGVRRQGRHGRHYRSGPEVSERARGPRRYSPRYKARILAEYERLDKAGKGALLRREGCTRR
jgi:hypothetical protein